MVEPGKGALDHPAHGAQPGAVCGPSSGDHGRDASLADQTAVLVVVIASVGDDSVRSSARSAHGAFDRRNPVKERDQLGDVVAVAPGDREGERDPGRVDQEVVLGAGSAPINRARARFGAPFLACT